MPILEAMASGKPCVALGKYNTKYLILDSNAGCIFNKKTQIAQAIECCLNNLEEYSQNALKFASRKEFDWTYHTEKLLEIYEGFLKK
jgi:glycosyltransferase involved in cell wall biosynthesis